MVLTLFTIFSENLFLKLNFVCFKSLILCARVVGTCHHKFYPKLLKYFSLTNELTVQYNCEVAIYYSVIMAPHTASLDRPEEWVLSCLHGIKYGSTTINCACPPLCAQPTIFLNIDFKGTMLEGGF